MEQIIQIIHIPCSQVAAEPILEVEHATFLTTHRQLTYIHNTPGIVLYAGTGNGVAGQETRINEKDP